MPCFAIIAVVEAFCFDDIELFGVFHEVIVPLFVEKCHQVFLAEFLVSTECLADLKEDGFLFSVGSLEDW